MKQVTLQESDLKVITAMIDSRLGGVERTIIERLEDTEEFFNTRFDEGEARMNCSGLFKKLDQIEIQIKSLEAALDRLCQCPKDKDGSYCTHAQDACSNSNRYERKG